MPVFQRKRSILFLIAMLALLLGVVAISLILVGQQAAVETRIKNALEAQLRLTRVFSLLQDAETGQRGYLLTGQESYLDPYKVAVEATPGEIATLKTMFAADRALDEPVRALEAAATEKLAELRRTVDLARGGDKAGALALVETGLGKATMDRVRDETQALNAAEQQRLDAGQAESLRIVAAARTRTVAALALTMLLGAMVIRDSHRIAAGSGQGQCRAAGGKPQDHGRDAAEGADRATVAAVAKARGDRPAHRRHRA